MSPKPRKPIRIAVTVTIEVSPDDWNAEYSTRDSDRVIRDSVYSDIRQLAEQHLHRLGFGKVVR